MKRPILLIITLILTGYSNSQTVTSIAAGDYYAPATWDCACVPNDSDTIYVNHAVTLNFGITYSGGLLQVGGAGSLVDGGAGNGIYIDGGNVTNIGTINCAGVMLESGYLNNIGQFLVDSLWTRDTVDNMGIIDITTNFRNDLNGFFTNVGTITVGNDCINEAIFFNNSEMYVHRDFANCNTTTSQATYDVGGLLCVYNDFGNCTDDTIRGNGTIRISGTSTNAGEMEGNFIVNTSSGALTSNTGTIAPGITFGTGVCEVGIEEETNNWIVYPNPAHDVLMSSVADVSFLVHDFSGRLILSATSTTGELNISSLAPGTYSVRLLDVNGYAVTRIVRKY